ncbi:MAG: hypothetical protein V1735_06465 [Nanoarchaeota archaeon]
MEDLPSYMKKELIKYISQEMSHGFSLGKIHGVLAKKGHAPDLVQEALEALKRNNYDPQKAVLEPIDDKLRARLLRHIIDCLIHYITFYKARGFSLEKIAQALKDYGHTEETITQAIEEIRKRNRKQDERFRMTIISIAIISIVAFLMVITFLTGATTPRVLAGFLPLLVTVLVAINVMRQKSRNLIWALPAILCIAFFIIGKTGEVQALRYMDTAVLSAVNLVLSYVYLFLLFQPLPEEWIHK